MLQFMCVDLAVGTVDRLLERVSHVAGLPAAPARSDVMEQSCCCVCRPADLQALGMSFGKAIKVIGAFTPAARAPSGTLAAPWDRVSAITSALLLRE